MNVEKTANLANLQTGKCKTGTASSVEKKIMENDLIESKKVCRMHFFQIILIKIVKIGLPEETS